jgi:pantetheine-phosphate adenylyltransferase
MKTALYAGSFDPITLGHLWVIKEASKLFDKVIVAVSTNISKQGKNCFSMDERVQLVKSSIQDMANVSVISTSTHENPQFTVNLAKSLGANYVVRGIRNGDDFAKEQAIRHINEDICSSVETVFMVPPRRLSEISSSMVKDLRKFEGWTKIVSKYVTPVVVNKFQSMDLNVKSVMIRLGFETEQAEKVKIVFYHTLQQREDLKYHNDNHVLACLNSLTDYAMTKPMDYTDFDCVALSLHFHDCVYVPGESINEEKSAHFFRSLVTPKTEYLKDFVSNMIMATKTHEKSQHYLCNLVSDIDMAILGANVEEFDVYERNIRDEYRQFEDSVYYPKRKKFLMECLKSSVYHTPEFYSMYHKKMVCNITRVLEEPGYKSVKEAE